jgi:outer membrane receptor protein involved in Fe transport
MREQGYPVPMFDPNTGITTFDEAAAEQWLIDHRDSLTIWHSIAAQYANSINIHAGVDTAVKDFFQPGTPEFNAAFNEITSRYNNDEGGTRFYDKSALYHVHGEYTFTPAFISEIKVGGNYRLYSPKSNGTIFYDSTTEIRNSEIGFYAGLQEKFNNNRLIASATMRLDKNENLDWISTPAASVVYKPAENTYLRASFSSALRNPTLTDQYLHLNVGRATLAGHIGEVDSLITIESFISGLNTLQWDTLDYFKLDPIRPEKVNTIEFGIRTSLFKSVFLDMGYYHNTYEHFLGYQLGIRTDLDLNSPPPVFPRNTIVYRYSSNSKTKVNTQGFSLGLNYYYSDHLTFNGNYSFNELTKSDKNDPIIPAYNTPKNKFNIGIAGRDFSLFNVGALEKVGFSVNYKWVEGFQFEGSPQFTGFVPTYDLLDAQVSVSLARLHTTIKVAASNLLNNQHFETYGGPYIGSLAYINLLYEFRKE